MAVCLVGVFDQLDFTLCFKYFAVSVPQSTFAIIVVGALLSVAWWTVFRYVVALPSTSQHRLALHMMGPSPLTSKNNSSSNT